MNAERPLCVNLVPQNDTRPRSKSALGSYVAVIHSGYNHQTGAHQRKTIRIEDATYADALRIAAENAEVSKEEELVELLQDALEAIDDILGLTLEDFEEYGRAVALEERLRISGELEMLGYDGFFDRD